MSVLNPRRSRRSISIVVTVMLLAAAVLTLIHWHQDSAGQRCEICFARHLPGIYVPFAVWFTEPTRIEWRSPIEKPTQLRSATLPFKPSRAPPSFLFL
jgi:hypothetical protein